MNIRKTLFTLSLGLLTAGCVTISDHDLQMSDSHRQLAELRLRNGELESAIREYQLALGFFPGDPETNFGIAEAFKHKGLLDKAEEHLLIALKEYPGHHEARLNLGVVYMLQKRWQESAVVFENLANDPAFIRPTRALVNLGWAHYNSGDIDSAKRAFERALSTDSNNHVAHLDLGILHYEQGELVVAVNHFHRATKILEGRPKEAFGPVEAEVRFRAAQAQIKLGQRSRAVEQLKIASELGGKTEWGLKSREYLEVLR